VPFPEYKIDFLIMFPDIDSLGFCAKGHRWHAARIAGVDCGNWAHAAVDLSDLPHVAPLSRPDERHLKGLMKNLRKQNQILI
jgi:hypothetical protein